MVSLGLAFRMEKNHPYLPVLVFIAFAVLVLFLIKIGRPNRKKPAACTSCLLALPLAGCYEYRGPYTKADVEEYLTGRYPDQTIMIRQKGLQTWDCWFEKLPYLIMTLKICTLGQNTMKDTGTR